MTTGSRADVLTRSEYRVDSCRMKTTRKNTSSSPESLRFSRINWLFLAAGIVVIGAGYVLLSRGSTVAAPLLLVAGYAVLIPLGIIR